MMYRSLAPALFFCSLLGYAYGDQKEEATKDNTIISSKKDAKECVCRACLVNFPKELEVPLEYLSDIGHQIHDARLKPDPVGLALAAKSLQVAEEVAGKKASVTSEEVLKDALHLGKLRGVSSELIALKSIVGDEATKKELSKEIAAAKAREKEARENAEAAAKGEKTKQLFGFLTVYNQTGECVRIYVSGQYKGVVHQGQGATFHVHDHNYHTELAAYCLEDNELVSTDCVEGHKHQYTWLIR